MVTNEHLQSIIDGKIGVIDSTQAVAVARELLAARGCVLCCWVAMQLWEMDQSIHPMAASVYAMKDALQKYDAARKAAE